MIIVAHQKDQFLDFQERNSLKIYPNENVETKISYSEFVGLPEIDHTGERTGKKGRKTCENINFDQCLYQKREEVSRKQTKDNCTAPYTPNNEKVCKNLDDIRIAYRIVQRPFEGHKTGHLTDIDCAMSCKTLFINFGAKSEIYEKKRVFKGRIQNSTIGGQDIRTLKPNKTPNIKAYFAPRIQKIEEHHLYSFMNLIAESGKIIFNEKTVSNYCALQYNVI